MCTILLTPCLYINNWLQNMLLVVSSEVWMIISVWDSVHVWSGDIQDCHLSVVSRYQLTTRLPIRTSKIINFNYWIQPFTLQLDRCSTATAHYNAMQGSFLKICVSHILGDVGPKHFKEELDVVPLGTDDLRMIRTISHARSDQWYHPSQADNKSQT